MSDQSSIGICISYLLDHEADDFTENPSDNHVYYHAMVTAYGKVNADRMLVGAMENLFSKQEIEGDQ